ncbi:MAG TPA: hypothetical protein VMT34_10575 [Aggregatilineales bacterium]|nr:hypothetical protein [Aggregatilineales bacterium]
MKTLLALMAAAIVSLVTLSGLAIGLGQRTRPDAVLDLPGCQRLPCWDGIEPGKTPLAAASFRLDQSYGRVPHSAACPSGWRLPGWVACLESRDDAIVNLIRLEPGPAEPALSRSLGAMVARFGIPVAVPDCWIQLDRVTGAQSLVIVLYFQGDVMTVVTLPRSLNALSPAQAITSVTYDYAAEEPSYRFDLPAWQGFKPFRGYHFDFC